MEGIEYVKVTYTRQARAQAWNQVEWKYYGNSEIVLRRGNATNSEEARKLEK